MHTVTSFRFSHRGGLEYLEAAPLTQYDFLVHAFLTRRGGVSADGFTSLNFSCREGDGPENVGENWRLLAEAFHLDLSQIILMRQVHGDRIVTIGSHERDPVKTFPVLPPERHACDALVTNCPEVVIAVKTADCVPIFLVDPIKRVIGVVHGGWRGTALNIAGQAVDVFRNQFSSQPGDILAAIGPAIGPCCYEVDAVVYEALHGYVLAGATPALEAVQGKDRWMLNLRLVNSIQLEQRGIPAKNIFSGSHCTSCQSDVFYSHRRDHGRTGRQVSFMMLQR